MLYDLVIYFTAIILFQLIGKWYDKFFLKSIVLNYGFGIIERFTIHLLLGVILSITSAATLLSNFTSLYFIFFIATIAMPLIFKNQLAKTNKLVDINIEKFQFKHLALVPIAFLFFFYHQFLFVYSANVTPFYDFLFLSKIANGLFENGIESFYSATSAYYGVNVNPHLYHYFDLWFTGIFSGIFNYSAYNVLLYVCFPFFHFIVFLLIYVIFNHFFQSFYRSFLLAFAFLFGAKVFINYQGSFFELVETYRGLPYTLFYKLLMIYVLALSAYFFYLKQLKLLALVSISLLMVVYPTTIPAFFTLAISVLIYHFYKNRTISYFSATILFVIFYIIVFQKIVAFDKMTNLTFHLYSLKQYLILFIESLIKILIEHYLTVFLFLFVAIKYFRLLIKNRIVIYTIICLSGSILYVYYNPPGIRDLNQIISNFSPVLLLILTIELLRFIKSKQLMNVVLLMSMIIGAYNVYFNFTTPNKKLIGKEIKHSKQFSKYLKAFVSKYSDKNYCSLSSFQPFDYYYHTDMKFNYLLTLKEFKTPLEIRVLFDDAADLESYQFKNRYYQPKLKFNSRFNNQKYIYEYLKKNNFKYLLVEYFKNDKIDQFLFEHCTLVMKDQATKDAIYLLN